MFSSIRWQKSIVVWLLATCLWLPSSVWSDEAILRVALVYNFIKFIEWPATDQQKTIQLCALDAKGDALNALQQLKGKTANKQVVEVVYLHVNDLFHVYLNNCHILYLSHPSADLPTPLPEGVVLIADEPEENDPNVSIALRRNKAGRIEFEVNLTAANRAGVRVSSQLLKLATKTRGGKS